MDVFDYSGSIESAQDAIARFGAAGFIRRELPSGYRDFDIKMLVISFNPAIIGTGVGNDIILATDKRVLIAGGLPIEPDPETDSILSAVSVGGELIPDERSRYRIIKPGPLAPGGVAVLYDMHLRQ